ncbi:MAG: DUF4350 domain-containing protein, partial [Chloroflexi bacterium]|nr:DUF4350 domain-containing protein [Chloroflexota bacterium]
MIRLILPVALTVFLLATALSSLFFYKGLYTPPQAQLHPMEKLLVPSPALASYQDTYSVAPSRILIDKLHSNDFTSSELNVLVQRLSDRGAAIDFLRDSDEKTTDALENKLAQADALVVISPWRAYTKEEARIVRRFVDTGGRLLLVSEPTRKDNINSLAVEFGLTFRNDYLYNLKENEGIYHHVRFRDIERTEVTRGLGEIVLFIVGSIIPVERGIISGDDNTLSSLSEAKGRLAVAALSADSHVLALGDLTFLTEPYNSYRDNNRFVSNIADFLTRGERTYYLRDFPSFLQRQVVIGYGDTTLLDSALTLKNLLTSAGHQVAIGQVSGAVVGGINLLLFDQTGSVSAFLSEAGITIGKEKVSIQNVGDFDREGRSVLYLSRAKKPYTLILLADAQKAMGDMVANLKSGEFRNLMVSDALMI